MSARSARYIWGRRIVGAQVHESQQTELAAELLASVFTKHSVQAEKFVLHSDNGGPMIGSTMLATMQHLASRRPSVAQESVTNAFVEALFRHLKHASSYSRNGFRSLKQARAWASRFVTWYNTTPQSVTSPQTIAITARDVALLKQRRDVYRAAQQRNPRRWTGAACSWKRIASITLNPER